MEMHPVVQMSKASIEKRDLNVLVRTIQPKRPKVVLEIGTWKGFSAEVWYESFHPEILISVEKDQKHEDGIEIKRTGYKYLYGCDSTSEEGFERIKKALKERTVDFLFIDGDHTETGVRRDWELYSSLMTEGGVVAFHDVLYTAPECAVHILWNELKKQYPYFEINIGGRSTGMGVLYYEQNNRSLAQKTLYGEL